MDKLEVGQKRICVDTDGSLYFEITAIGKKQALYIYNGEDIEVWGNIDYLLRNSIPYQEPKPVRKLEAWETKGNGIARGTIEFCLSDSESSIYNKEHANEYRKLSDSELKELIKGVIGE